MSRSPTQRGPVSPLLSKLDDLRAQRDMLRQEVAALSARDRELAHLSSPVVLTPGIQAPERRRTTITERLEAGLQAMVEQTSPSPLGVSRQSLARGSPAQLWSAWGIHRMPEPSASPVVQRHLSVDELKAIVSNSMSQLSSQSHATPASGPPHEYMLSREDSVSLSLPSMASHQHHRSSPPRPKRSGENGRGRDTQASVPFRLDREANRVPVLPPDSKWTLPSPRNYQAPPSKPPANMLSGESEASASAMTDLHASSGRLAAQDQELRASKEQLLRQGKGLQESQVDSAMDARLEARDLYLTSDV